MPDDVELAIDPETLRAKKHRLPMRWHFLPSSDLLHSLVDDFSQAEHHCRK
jgi:hypothetical protein